MHKQIEQKRGMESTHNKHPEGLLDSMERCNMIKDKFLQIYHVQCKQDRPFHLTRYCLTKICFDPNFVASLSAAVVGRISQSNILSISLSGLTCKIYYIYIYIHKYIHIYKYWLSLNQKSITSIAGTKYEHSHIQGTSNCLEGDL